MSASAIADGFVTMLSAASCLGVGAVSKEDYGVIERVATCCLVIEGFRLESNVVAFGSPPDRERLWTFLMTGYSKDTGDGKAAMNRTYGIVDAVVAAVESDPTVQGTGEDAGVVAATREPGEAYIVGNVTFLPVHIDVEVKEWTG